MKRSTRRSEMQSEKVIALRRDVQSPYKTRSISGVLRSKKPEPPPTSRNLELEKELKKKYGIKESSVVLYDHMYDKSIPLHLRCFLSKKNEEKSHTSTSVSSNQSKNHSWSVRGDTSSSNSSISTIAKTSVKRNSNSSYQKKGCKSKNSSIITKAQKKLYTENWNDIKNETAYKHESVILNTKEQKVSQENVEHSTKHLKKEKRKKNKKKSEDAVVQMRSMPIIDDVDEEQGRNENNTSMEICDHPNYNLVIKKTDNGDNYFIVNGSNTSHNANSELPNKEPLWNSPNRQSIEEAVLQDIEKSTKNHDSGTMKICSTENLYFTDILAMFQEETNTEKDAGINNNYIDMKSGKQSEVGATADFKIEEGNCFNTFEWSNKDSANTHEIQCQKTGDNETSSMLFSNSNAVNDHSTCKSVLVDLLEISTDISSFSQVIPEVGVPEVGGIVPRGNPPQAVHGSIDPFTSANNTMEEPISSYFSKDSLITDDCITTLNETSQYLVNSSMAGFPDENANLNIEPLEIDQKKLTAKKSLPKITEDSILPKGTINLSAVKGELNCDKRKCNDSMLPSGLSGSPLSSLALTIDNLTKFNEVTENEKPANNVIGISRQDNKVQLIKNTFNCDAEEQMLETESQKRHRKRRWIDNRSCPSTSQVEGKKIKLNRSCYKKNVSEFEHFERYRCLDSLLFDPKTITENSAKVHDAETAVNNCDMEEAGTSKKIQQANSIEVDSLDTIQVFTRRKSISDTSTETELNDRSKKKRLQFGRGSCRNTPLVASSRNQDLINESPTGKRQDVHEVNGTDKDNISESVSIVAVQGLSQKQGELFNEDADDSDVIKLYVDEDDRMFLTDTEVEELKSARKEIKKPKTNEPKSGLNGLKKETANNEVKTTDYGPDKECSYSFDFNLYVKNNNIECNEALELIPDSNTYQEKNFSKKLNTDDKRKQSSDTKTNCANDASQKETVDVGCKETLMPTISEQQEIHLKHSSVDQPGQRSQEECVEHELNNEDDETELGSKTIRKMFLSYCYRYLKYGNCYNMVECQFNHRVRLLIQNIQSKKYNQCLAIFDHLLQRQYYYLAKTTYIYALKRFLNYNQITELYERMVEGKIINSTMIDATVNAFIKIETDPKTMIYNLVNVVPANDTMTLRNILKIVEAYVPVGEYWSTLRSFFLRLRPKSQHVEKILSECVTMEKDLQHLEDVNKFVVRGLSPAIQSTINGGLLFTFHNLLRRKRSELVNSVNQNNRITSPAGGIATIASPDVPGTHEQSKPKKLAEVVKHDSTCKDTGQMTAEAPSDETSFVVHRIDGVPEPSSAYKDRFWKFYVDLYRVKEGLRHGDYDYVIEILDNYANADQRTLLARSLYNILRAEIKRSQHHLRSIIERTVPRGVMATLHTIIQAGRYILNALVDEDLWVLAYTLQKSLEPYNLRLDAEFVLLSAQIYIANRNSLKAFYLLKHNNIIYTNRCKWRVPSNENDVSLRIMVINLLLELLAKEATEHALFLFEFLVKDQPCNYSPIDLSRYVDAIMTQFLLNDCASGAERMADVLIKHNFTLSRLLFRTLISYLYDNNINLGRQMYQYGIGLGIYNDVLLTYPLFVIINLHWTEGEQYYLFSELFERLAMDIGLAIGRLKKNQLRIFVIFENCPPDYSRITMDDQDYTKKLQTCCKKTLRNMLEKRFKPPIKIVHKSVGKIFKLQSTSVVNYLQRES